VTFDGDYYPQVARGCPRATLEDYDMYYTEEELTQALERARVKIDKITERTSEYTRGTNDCFALMVAYDEELRGDKSKARDLSIEDYAVECGYELIPNKRPLLGDIAFDNGCLINEGKFWVSTSEENTGTCHLRQVQFLERHVSLGRPIRS
jgi:hypothetical protein